MQQLNIINGNERMQNYKAFVLWMPCHINQCVFNDIIIATLYYKSHKI